MSTYQEHADHEFGSRSDRYDGFGDREAQMELYYDDFGCETDNTAVVVDHSSHVRLFEISLWKDLPF